MFTIVETLMQKKTHPESIAARAAEAKGDPEPFERLYDHYVQPVYRYLNSAGPIDIKVR